MTARGSHELSRGQFEVPGLVLEIATLYVRAGEEQTFEAAFAEARKIISSMQGFVSLELDRCIEQRNKYALLVRWQKLEDHTEGFRNSPQYQQWRALLHHFYDPPPQVEHYEKVF
jgi:heme-degrading monooxygenase HmoA